MLDKNDIKLISDLMDEKFTDFAVIVNQGFENQKKWTEEFIRNELREGLENQKQWTKEFTKGFVREEFHQHNILMEQKFHEFKVWAEGTFITRSEFHMRFDDLENRVEKIEIAIKAINSDTEEIKTEIKSINNQMEELKKQGKDIKELEKRVSVLETQVLELKAV